MKFLDEQPVSCNSLGRYFGLDGKQLKQQYKEHLSDYLEWEQQTHAEDWIVFPQNIGAFLTTDETSLSQGKQYTIVTNKSTHGRKGIIVAMVKGKQAQTVIKVLNKIPKQKQNQVKEVTLDMAANMAKIIKSVFPYAKKVTDRFQVQQLAFDAVQELRIKYRWKAIDNENAEITSAKEKNEISLKTAYELAMRLNYIFENTKDKGIEFTRLAQWYDKIELSKIDSFETVTRSIQANYLAYSTSLTIEVKTLLLSHLMLK